MDYDPYNPMPMLQISMYMKNFRRGVLLSAPDQDSKLKHRENVIRNLVAYITHIILKTSKKSDPVVAYLAVNLADRYISKNTQFLAPMVAFRSLIFVAVGCLRIAWKLRHKDSSIFNIPLLERIPRKVEMNNMEVQILKKLDWEIRTVTPFHFVHVIEAKLFSSLGLNRRTINEIIVQSSFFQSIAQHKAPVIAASALLTASYFLYRGRFHTLIRQLKPLGFDEETLRRCTNKMIGVSKELNLVSQGTENQAVGGGSDQEKGEFAFELKWIKFLEKDTKILNGTWMTLIEKCISS